MSGPTRSLALVMSGMATMTMLSPSRTAMSGMTMVMMKGSGRTEKASGGGPPRLRESPAAWSKSRLLTPATGKRRSKQRCLSRPDPMQVLSQ